MELNALEVSNIRERIEQIKRDLESYRNFLQSRTENTGYHSDSIKNNSSNETISRSYYTAKNELKDLEKKLSKSTYVSYDNNDSIKIGSKFTVAFSDCKEAEDFILTEKIIGKTSIYGYISVESDFGKSIIGKHTGDKFSYELCSPLISSVVSGVVVNVKKEYTDYVHFIREQERQNRKSKKGLYIKNLALKSGNIDLYKKFNGITISQKHLLEEELLKLKSNIPKKDLNRINNIQTILDQRGIVSTNPDSNIIDIGSSFSIMLFNGEKTITKRLEMINQAFTTETDDSYIELISSLGAAIYGLGENANFCLKNYSGIVYDIDNTKYDERFITRDPKIYQKAKKK